MLVAPEGPGAPQLPSREAKGLQERQRKTRVHRARRERSSMPRLWGDVSFTWLSSKTGLSGSESLPLPPLLPPRDKGLLWEGEPASEGGGLSVSTTSGFVLPMGTSVFPPLPQADTSSFNDSAGQNKAGLGVKARHHTPNQLGPWEEGHWELAQLLGTWL